ncbi:ribosomal protein S18 acetylase RimI-like enzyme [Saccharococcus thermophilus]|uniref:Ribosomal protein S18 acetylase RimI-like enzyme n=2 Tax=Saccharococcus thermophilus TaxID=29396 RepID=A0A846MDK4_9BACL|nr:ribosomal protein S18 acetylase RimI-like enzyme [Saccharococcus thermophilus]
MKQKGKEGMIQEIDIEADEWAEAVLLLQFRSYAVEARLIGFLDLPPLQDTVATLQQCGERFFGYMKREQLAGAISYERIEKTVQICRLMVDPDFFRQGIASALIEFVCHKEQNASEIIVTTGSTNMPALRLYQRHGFHEVEQMRMPEGIFLTKLVKRLA